MLLRRKMLKLLLCASLCVFVFFLSCFVTADDQDDSASLLFCDDGIRNFSLASGADSLVMSCRESPAHVNYHMKSKVCFWTDNTRKINKAPLWQEGARPSVIRSGAFVHGIAVDWIHNLIYWTELNNNAIDVSRLDGSMARTVIKEKGINPFAIVVNPAEGFMFWSDLGATKKIERCNMDGTNRKVIVKEDIDKAFSLAIDLDSQTIFWADIIKNYVCSSKFDGKNRKNLITHLRNPTYLDVYERNVYFVQSESRHEAVYQASKVDGSGFTKVFGGMGSLECLKVFHSSKQLEGYNVCGEDNGGCSHLCLPTSGHTFSCACPNNRTMGSDNFTCLNTDGYAVTTPSLTTNAPSSQLPFAINQTNCSSSTEKNKNVDATIGSFYTYGMFAVVIASVALIAVVGMLIYIIHLLARSVANAGNPNPVQRRNCEENMYMEAPL